MGVLEKCRRAKNANINLGIFDFDDYDQSPILRSDRPYDHSNWRSKSHPYDSGSETLLAVLDSNTYDTLLENIKAVGQALRSLEEDERFGILSSLSVQRWMRHEFVFDVPENDPHNGKVLED